ncbi:MAG TPA: hypothetical protein VF596_03930 [Pyrinomonadaceae bacterium]|jgi:TolB protein
MTKLVSIRRAGFSVLAALFLAAPFFVSIPAAKMQSGANKIAFTRYVFGGNYKVMTANADGTNQTELANGSNPVWSKNGEQIAYISGDGEISDIFLMNSDGSNHRRLTETAQAYNAAWSPVGNRIAFESSHEKGWHIYLINTDGTNQQRLPVPAHITGEHSPAWTPDGSKIVFIGDRIVKGVFSSDFYSIKPDGTELTRLTNLNALLEWSTPAISPDGGKIYFEHQSQIYSVTTDGGGILTNISNNSSFSDANPALSPDGSKIVFERDNQGLFIMNTDGTDAAPLIGNAANPVWNPTAIQSRRPVR